jgi:cobalt-zinc-cadmium efflux system membrane fusion protein
MKSKSTWVTAAIVAAGLFTGYLVLRTEKASSGGHDHGEAGHDAKAGGHADQGEEAHGGHDGHSEGHDGHSEGHDGHSEGHGEHGDNRGGEAEEGPHRDQVEIAPESVRASGIEVETAGPAVMKATLSLNGKIMPNEDRLAHIFARFPGVVKEVRKHLGETVKKGETLAIVESNESLEAYPVVSQIEGTVIRKHVTAGETVGAEEELFAITDLNSVWADFSVYRHDFSRLRKGQKVIVDAGEGSGTVTAALAYLSPIGAEHTQTMTARAALPNAGGQWPPGLFIKGKVILSEFRVPVAVKEEALQTMGKTSVVFVNVGDAYEARPLELGRRDGQWVEAVSGLSPGERYVTRNSYVIKADIGKAGAAHEH